MILEHDVIPKFTYPESNSNSVTSEKKNYSAPKIEFIFCIDYISGSNPNFETDFPINAGGS